MEVSEKLLIPKRIIFHNWSTIIFHPIYGGFLNYTIYVPPFFPSLLILNWSMTDHLVSCLNWDPHQRTAAWRMGKKNVDFTHEKISTESEVLSFFWFFDTSVETLADHFGMIRSRLKRLRKRHRGVRHLDAVVLGSTALLGLVSSRFCKKATESIRGERSTNMV
jgi:AraC-like DNA-binding protein